MVETNGIGSAPVSITGETRTPSARATARSTRRLASVSDRSIGSPVWLQRIHAVLGGDTARDIEVSEREWASRMAEARNGIDRATIEFLHAVALLSDVSDLSYERLVHELDTKKRGALREALGAAR